MQSAVTAFVQTLSRAAWRHCTISRSGPGRGLYLVLACLALPAAFCSLVGSFFMPPSAAHDACAIGGLALIALGLGMLIRCGRTTEWLYDGVSEVGDVGEGGGGAGDGANALASQSVSIGVSAIGEPSDEADAAAVVRVLPLASCVVVFWMVYSQMSSNFQLQGFQMDLHTYAVTERRHGTPSRNAVTERCHGTPSRNAVTERCHGPWHREHPPP